MKTITFTFFGTASSTPRAVWTSHMSTVAARWDRTGQHKPSSGSVVWKRRRTSCCARMRLQGLFPSDHSLPSCRGPWAQHWGPRLWLNINCSGPAPLSLPSTLSGLAKQVITGHGDLQTVATFNISVHIDFSLPTSSPKTNLRKRQMVSRIMQPSTCQQMLQPWDAPTMSLLMQPEAVPQLLLLGPLSPLSNCPLATSRLLDGVKALKERGPITKHIMERTFHTGGLRKSAVPAAVTGERLPTAAPVLKAGPAHLAAVPTLGALALGNQEKTGLQSPATLLTATPRTLLRGGQGPASSSFSQNQECLEATPKDQGLGLSSPLLVRARQHPGWLTLSVA